MGFALTWQSIGGIVLMLLVVIAIHEFGHFIVAKRAGIMVLEYSIGFGPRLVSRTWGETQYSIRLLPLGGYVRMAGMTGTELPPADGGARGFIRAGAGTRAVVLAAGGIMNLILAALLFTGIAVVGGAAPLIESGGALAHARVPSGWQVVGIGSQRITSLTKIRSLVQQDRGRPVTVTLRKWTSSAEQEVTITPQLHWIGTSRSVKIPIGAQILGIDGRPVPSVVPAKVVSQFPAGSPLEVTYLNSHNHPEVAGVSRGSFASEWLVGYIASSGNPLVSGLGGRPQPVYQALATGIYTVPDQIVSTFVNLWTLIAVPHHNSDLRLSGPVGIAEETSIAAQISPTIYLTLMGLISVNLGLLNLLPIPFLDGGRLFFVLLEKVRRRKANPQVEAVVHAVGLALIAMLFVYVTYGDISQLVR